jgi:hypothetical protein
MFIAALWTTAKLQKQPRCLTSNEWINNVLFAYSEILFIHKAA